MDAAWSKVMVIATHGIMKNENSRFLCHIMSANKFIRFFLGSFLLFRYMSIKSRSLIRIYASLIKVDGLLLSYWKVHPRYASVSENLRIAKNYFSLNIFPIRYVFVLVHSYAKSW